jgi:hypothetical protein
MTGGGAEAVGWLFSVPGGSRSILEVIVPYDEHSLADFLGYYPSSFCSPQTARAMADRALQRAHWLTPGEPVLGLACTASLRSERPKRGAHRFHLAIQTNLCVLTFSLTLTKDARTREEEERIVDLVLLNAMAESLELSERVDVPLLPGERIEQQMLPSEDPLASLFAGRFAAVCLQTDGRANPHVPRPKLILSGSFNPLHAGHLALAKSAAEWTGFEAAFELTILNADKPPLPPEEVRRRTASFIWQAPLWLTRAATFVEKAELFPGAVFVVGSDTAERIVQARFYGGSEERLALAMNRLRELGCRFLVAGRVNPNGDFVGLDNLEIPKDHLDLFASVPAERFRVDLSSTQLRQADDQSKRAGGVSC